MNMPKKIKQQTTHLLKTTGVVVSCPICATPITVKYEKTKCPHCKVKINGKKLPLS
ncbi:hypothetical protein [Vagococcus intermedius]|uniref:Uncharacterized protein n=1 Tax=Vagococcus intermedius TaxID=2991418 RepID=A0AAF0I7A9_9ENTE|nr:hypothetical protein [Vagococcus intermedius]WEG72871.1 hypothetical protein OL234_07760 [Vagococcus intermedius]WEG74958.1 hypothetical protein OL235_07755 [Vagococcus intermedius]